MPPKDPKSEFKEAQQILSSWIRQIKMEANKKLESAKYYNTSSIQAVRMQNFRDLIDAADQIQAGLDRRNIAATVTGQYTALLGETRQDQTRFLEFSRTVNIENQKGFDAYGTPERVEKFAGSVTLPSLAELAAARLPDRSILSRVPLIAQPYKPAPTGGANLGRS